jgi:hypothetical protein
MYNPTGLTKNKAFGVYATALQVIREFVQRVNPNVVIIAPFADAQFDLYKMMSRKMKAPAGYHIEYATGAHEGTILLTRDKQPVLETMNTQTDLKWYNKADAKQLTGVMGVYTAAEASISGQTIITFFAEGTFIKGYEVAFYNGTDTQTRIQFDPTNNGISPLAILSIVVQSIEEFIEREQPSMVWMQPFNAKQGKIYDAMYRKFKVPDGYDKSDSGGIMMLTKTDALNEN